MSESLSPIHSLYQTRTCVDHLNFKMSEKLVGSYQFEKNDKFEEFLAETNVGLMARKAMASTKPAITITKDGDKWSITFKVMIKTQTITFEIGKEFSEENPMLGEKSKVGALIKL